jgi:hypothetical protein
MLDVLRAQKLLLLICALVIVELKNLLLLRHGVLALIRLVDVY